MVKLVNYVRSEVRKGNQVVGRVIDDGPVFQDDRYLLPVLEDDALLYSLEDIFASDDVGGEPVGNSTSNELSEENATVRIVKLEEELRELQQRFSDYRETVDRTLETRWDSGDISAVPQVAEDYRKAEIEDTGYFESYSYNGADEQ